MFAPIIAEHFLLGRVCARVSQSVLGQRRNRGIFPLYVCGTVLSLEIVSSVSY